MTNIERLKVRIPEATDAELEDVLESAKDVILSRCFVSVSRTAEEDKSLALEENNEKVLSNRSRAGHVRRAGLHRFRR